MPTEEKPLEIETPLGEMYNTQWPNTFHYVLLSTHLDSLTSSLWKQDYWMW